MIRIKIWNLATKLKHHNRQPIVLLGIKSGAIGRKSQLFYVNSTTATPINLIWKMHNIYSFSILNYQKCSFKWFNLKKGWFSNLPQKVIVFIAYPLVSENLKCNWGGIGEARKPRSWKMNCQFAAIYLTVVSWKYILMIRAVAFFLRTKP